MELKMSGKERYMAVLRQDKPDRLPIRIGNYNMFLCHYYGLSINAFIDDPAKSADVFIRFVREFALDSVKAGLGYILYGCGPEMGTQWKFTPTDFPACARGIISDRKDLDRLSAPETPLGYFKNFLDINTIVRDEIGSDVFLGVSVLGPFSAIAFLRGFDKLLMDIATDLPFFIDMMKKGVEISQFIGRHCLALNLPWTNVMEIFLVPGVVNPKFYHAHIAPFTDEVCRMLATPPLANSNAVFMGRSNDFASQSEGRLLSDYYFGTGESIDVIRKAVLYMLPGFPRLVSLSGRALVAWTEEQIISFLREGVDFFINERREYPALNLVSIQAADAKEAAEVAGKLSAIRKFRDGYRF